MRRTNRRWLVWLIAFAALSLIVVGCGNGEDDAEQAENQSGQAQEPLDTSSDKVIATYDGLTSGEVEEGEFNRFLNIFSVINPQMAMFMVQPEFKDQMLREYIASKSVSSQVETTSEMEQQAEEFVGVIKEQYEQREEDFAAYIDSYGFSEDDLRRFFEDQMKIEEHFNGEITDDELEQRYAEMDEERDMRLYTAKVRHILIQINEERDEDEAKKRAEEVKDKLDSGQNFAELAGEYSDDGSGANGGSLGEEMTPLATETGPTYVQSFGEAARDLPLNEVSDPVKSEFGYHLIEVEDREQLSFEQAKDLVRADMWLQKYQNYMENDLEINTELS